MTANPNYQFCLFSPTTLLSITSSGSVELELRNKKLKKEFLHWELELMKRKQKKMFALRIDIVHRGPSKFKSLFCSDPRQRKVAQFEFVSTFNACSFD